MYSNILFVIVLIFFDTNRPGLRSRAVEAVGRRKDGSDGVRIALEEGVGERGYGGLSRRVVLQGLNEQDANANEGENRDGNDIGDSNDKKQETTREGEKTNYEREEEAQRKELLLKALLVAALFPQMVMVENHNSGGKKGKGGGGGGKLISKVEPDEEAQVVYTYFFLYSYLYTYNTYLYIHTYFHSYIFKHLYVPTGSSVASIMRHQQVSQRGIAQQIFGISRASQDHSCLHQRCYTCIALCLDPLRGRNDESGERGERGRERTAT